MAGAVFRDVIFIVPQTENGNVVRVACEGRVVNDELEQRAAVFCTTALFWEVGDHEWQINGDCFWAGQSDGCVDISIRFL